MEYSWRNGIPFPGVSTPSERLWQLAPFFLVSVFSILFPLWTLFLLVEVLSRNGNWGRVVSTLALLSFSVYMLNSILTDRLDSKGAGSIRWICLIAFVAAILVAPLPIMLMKRRVVKLATQGDYDRALRISKIWLRTKVYGRPFRGWIMLQAGRYSEALDLLKDSAFDEKGRPRLTNVNLYFYAVALMNEDRNAEAQELLEAAIQVPQKMDYFRFALADCLLSQNKDASRACELLEQVMANLKKKHQSAKQRTIMAHCIAVHAWALACCGRREESEARLQEALSRSKGFEAREVAALQHLAGVTWQTLGDLERARAAFQEAAKLYPHGDVGLRARRKLAELGAEI